MAFNSIVYIDSTQFIFDSLYIKLTDLMNSENELELKKNLSDLFNVKKSASMKLDAIYRDSFHENLDLFNAFAADIKNEIYLIDIIWIEEGTRPYIVLDFNKIIPITKRTPGNIDDRFFRLIKEIYGFSGEPGVSMPVWMIQKTDISGSSRLGDNTFCTNLIKINQLQKRGKNIFWENCENIKDHLIDDLIRMSTFENSRDEVVSELHKILRLKFLSDGEKTIIRNRIGEINDPDGRFQFDCKTAKCNFE